MRSHGEESMGTRLIDDRADKMDSGKKDFDLLKNIRPEGGTPSANDLEILGRYFSHDGDVEKSDKGYPWLSLAIFVVLVFVCLNPPLIRLALNRCGEYTVFFVQLVALSVCVGMILWKTG
jgi:hypothetical protein